MSSYRIFDYQAMPSCKGCTLKCYASGGAESSFSVGGTFYATLYVDDEGLVHVQSYDGAIVSAEPIPQGQTIKVFDDDGTLQRTFTATYW